MGQKIVHNLSDFTFLSILFLQTVPACQNLYKNSFTYHSLKEDKTLPFAECLEFIGKGLTVFDQGVVLFSVL